MQSSFAQANLVAAIQNAWLARRQSHGVVDHRSVYRSQVFDQESVAFGPDPRVAPRYFRLRIESRKIDLGKYVRVWIRSSHKIAVLLQNERRIKFSGTGYHQF